MLMCTLTNLKRALNGEGDWVKELISRCAQFVLRLLWKKFLYKVIFRSHEHQGQYYRNQFGSIISPLEFRIAWDPSLSERVITLNNLISPSNERTKFLNLIRVGSVGDGGYYLPETYRNCDGAISGGISNNNDFENELALSDIPVIQFDHTINEAPNKNKNLYFKKVKLGNNGFSLRETLSAFKELTGVELRNGILKLDIEGSEFDFLANSSVETLSNFDIIVLELHFLGEIYKDIFWKNVKDALILIRQNHKPIFATGNNSRPYVQIGGLAICDILEITFIRNSAPVPNYDKNMNVTAQVEGRAPLIVYF